MSTRVEVVKRVVMHLCERADEEGIDTLSPMQAAMVVVWSVRGIIGNGGFEYLAEGWASEEADRAMSLERIASAFEVFGFGRAGEAVRSVDAELLRECHGSYSWQSLAQGAIDWERFRDRERVLFELNSADLLSAFEAAMADNPGEFAALYRRNLSTTWFQRLPRDT